MTDLVAFLNARLAEIDVDADLRAVHDVRCASRDYIGNLCNCTVPDWMHAEVVGQRRIVEWCGEVIGDRDLSNYGEFGSLKDDPESLAVTLAVETLKNLAAPFAWHADYRPVWRVLDG